VKRHLIAPYSIKLKCFKIASAASIDHPILNQIMVGKVLTVDDQIKAKLEIKAKI
jgi:hypothetical protein